jgi:tRNA 2-thiocytidine biosynthesis protein TtcA
MFRSLMNVRPSHLADPTLFDFASLAAISPELPLADTENSSQLSDER